MQRQNLIKQTLLQPKSVAAVQQILEDNSDGSRFEIAGRVCEHFAFFNAMGKPQKSSCANALRDLERIGLFDLPATRGQHTPGGPRRLTNPVEQPHGVPSKA